MSHVTMLEAFQLRSSEKGKECDFCKNKAECRLAISFTIPRNIPRERFACALCHVQIQRKL